MKRRLKIIVGTLLTVVIIGIVSFHLIQPQLVTGRINELQKIVIHDYGSTRSDGPELIITIDDEQIMSEIFNILHEARPARNNNVKAPFSMISPRYRIEIYYHNRKDEILVHVDIVGRWLGRPDMWTVYRTSEVANMIESILDELIEG